MKFEKYTPIIVAVITALPEFIKIFKHKKPHEKHGYKHKKKNRHTSN